jgi:hypothetical protein
MPKPTQMPWILGGSSSVFGNTLAPPKYRNHDASAIPSKYTGCAQPAGMSKRTQTQRRQSLDRLSTSPHTMNRVTSQRRRKLRSDTEVHINLRCLRISGNMVCASPVFQRIYTCIDNKLLIDPQQLPLHTEKEVITARNLSRRGLRSSDGTFRGILRTVWDSHSGRLRQRAPDACAECDRGLRLSDLVISGRTSGDLSWLKRQRQLAFVRVSRKGWPVSLTIWGLSDHASVPEILERPS